MIEGWFSTFRVLFCYIEVAIVVAFSTFCFAIFKVDEWLLMLEFVHLICIYFVSFCFLWWDMLIYYYLLLVWLVIMVWAAALACCTFLQWMLLHIELRNKGVFVAEWRQLHLYSSNQSKLWYQWLIKTLNTQEFHLSNYYLLTLTI